MKNFLLDSVEKHYFLSLAKHCLPSFWNFSFYPRLFLWTKTFWDYFSFHLSNYLQINNNKKIIKTFLTINSFKLCWQLIWNIWSSSNQHSWKLSQVFKISNLVQRDGSKNASTKARTSVLCWLKWSQSVVCCLATIMLFCQVMPG